MATPSCVQCEQSLRLKVHELGEQRNDDARLELRTAVADMLWKIEHQQLDLGVRRPRCCNLQVEP